MKKVLAKIKSFFENLMFGHRSRTLEAGIVRKCGVDVVQGLQEQYDKTFMAALEGNAARNALGEFERGGVMYSFGVTQEDIDLYVDNAYTKQNDQDYKKYAVASEQLVKDAKPDVDVSDYAHALRDNDIRHIRNSHGEDTNEKYPVTKEDLKRIPHIVANYDKVFVKTNARGTPGLVYVKVGKDNVVYYVEAVTQEYHNEKLLVNKQMIKAGIDEIPNLHGLIAAINKKESSSQYLADLKAIRKAYVQDVKENYPAISISQNDEKSTPDAKKLLENRVSGDDLLNAQDLIADVQELGGQVDEYGYITLYHRTSADKAAAIRSTGEMVAKENGLFFSTKQEGQNVGYGDTVVTFSIPAEKLLLDDVFDDEAHLRFPLKKPGRVSVKEYLVGEDAGDTGLHSDPEDDIDNRTFSYSELVAKGDLQGVVIGKARQVPLKANGGIDDDAIVKDVKSKCQTITTKGGTTYFVSVPDIGRNVEISKDGIVHGFIKLKNKSGNALPVRSETNARAALEIPQILVNSIEVNRSQRGSNLDVPYTHVMIGTVAMEDAQGKLEYYAVRSMILERKNQNPILVEANVIGKLYAVNAKK